MRISSPSPTWCVSSSPPSSPLHLPIYAEAMALAYADASSDDSSVSPSSCLNYDPRVMRFLDIMASESDDDFIA